MKSLLCILLIFISLGTKAQQTYSISGIVTDGKGMTLPGATVFITNSRYIQATNNGGKFSFGNITPGTYEVVVKMLGFEPDIQSVTVRDKPISLIVTLKESITALKAVTISGTPDPNREKYLELFLKNFIGETVNSEQCKLLNPNALRFHFNAAENALQASADDFLVVENQALGYTLKYLLTKFDLELHHGVLYITGSPYFEELKGTVIQQKKWEENRRVAYLSSQRHFFNAVMNNTVKDEGFLVYKIIDRSAYIAMKYVEQSACLHFSQLIGHRMINQYAVEVSAIDSLFTPDDKNFKTLISPRKVAGNDTMRLGFIVVYTGEGEAALFYHTGNPLLLPVQLSKKKSNHRQISQLLPLTDTITIDRNYGWPEKGFDIFGYWAWERIADLTPLDYFGETAMPAAVSEENHFNKVKPK